MHGMNRKPPSSVDRDGKPRMFVLRTELRRLAIYLDCFQMEGGGRQGEGVTM